MGITIIGNKICINGKEILDAPKRTWGNSITTVNDKIYINGYEFKNGEWKRTLTALWYLIF